MSSTVFMIYNDEASVWHDYSNAVIMKGMGWSRNDIDAADAGRTQDGRMHRAKVDVKRTMDYQLMPNRGSMYANLDTDLSQEEFLVKYRDLHGITEKTFYCSKFAASLNLDIDDNPKWREGAFTIIEV